MAGKKKKRKPIRKFKKALASYIRELLIGVILIILSKIVDKLFP